MSKKVLAIYYSQSGQLGQMIDRFTAPIAAAGIDIEKIQIKPMLNYDFPWTGKRFFDVMPDCVLSKPAPLQPFTLQEQVYDLIILGYQPWFLSPSIPVNSLLNHPAFKNVLNNTPVITMCGARNMWINAFDRIKASLTQAGAKLVGNIALVDRHPNPISFITIFYWMLSGKKDSYLNIFPKPGVSDVDIENTAVFGSMVAQKLQTTPTDWTGTQQQLVEKGAVMINYKLMYVEGKAKYIFAAWAKFISKRQNKTLWLAAFKYYLFIALFIGAPILLTLDAVFVKPFVRKKIKAKTNYYLQF
jgi:hypothetical protein